MTAPTLPSPEVQAAGCEQLLRDLCDDYYAGCKLYAALPGGDTPQRVFHRVRLATLQQVCDRLCAALGWAEPDWAAIREIAEGETLNALDDEEGTL